LLKILKVNIPANPLVQYHIESICTGPDGGSEHTRKMIFNGIGIGGFVRNNFSMPFESDVNLEVKSDAGKEKS
jgi:hypothetical protein